MNQATATATPHCPRQPLLADFQIHRQQPLYGTSTVAYLLNYPAADMHLPGYALNRLPLLEPSLYFTNLPWGNPLLPERAGPICGNGLMHAVSVHCGLEFLIPRVFLGTKG